MSNIDKIKEEILNEISFRLEEDHDLRFTAREIVDTYGDYHIVIRNGWYGVMYGKEVCIPSIYDNIEISLAGNILIAQTDIMGKKGLWVLREKKGEEVIEPIYEALLISPYYKGVILKDDGKEGLYCLERKEQLLELKYEQVSFNTCAKHVWAQVNREKFLFLNLTSGSSTYIPKMIVPLEHEAFSVYMHNDGRLELLDGDSFLLRKLVAQLGGRLKLSNSRNGRIYVTDANGFILNS